MSIVIFYHVGGLDPRCRFIVNEQMRMLERSGLYNKCSRLFVGVVGNAYALDWLKPWTKAELLYHDEDLTTYESRTLQELHKFASECPPSDKVLYFHTKGAQSQWVRNSRAVSCWRQVMGYWLVEDYARCFQLMKEHDLDVIGGNLIDMCPDPSRMKLFCEGRSHACHYSGNFWWAKAGYIRRLHAPSIYRKKDYPGLHHHLRLRCENWVLSLFPEVRAGECFRYTNPHPYETPWDRDESPHGYFRVVTIR